MHFIPAQNLNNLCTTNLFFHTDIFYGRAGGGPCLLYRQRRYKNKMPITARMRIQEFKGSMVILFNCLNVYPQHIFFRDCEQSLKVQNLIEDILLWI